MLKEFDRARPVFFYAVENINPILPRLVWIAPGSFAMGSPDCEQDRAIDEGPQRTVTVRQGFWLGKYEVTQAEYHEVMGVLPGEFKRDWTCPVEMVRWEDATNYCGKLTERERLAGRLPAGYVYRLPTEAEWEYACRAGTTTRYSYGDDPEYKEISRRAWWSCNSDSRTHPVGQKPPNPWGLFDMHGNVFESCLDVYGPYPGSENLPSLPPPTGTHVRRGGSWFCPPSVLRSACRHGPPPELASYLGFRVALAPSE